MSYTPPSIPGAATGNNSLPVVLATDQVLSLPVGASTAAKQDTGITSLASILAKLSSDPATQTTAAAILAKLSADPATQTTLAAVLAKLTADPATQTTLAAILAKMIAAPATAANQATEIASLANLDVALSTRLKPADSLAAVTSITNALPAGTNLMGKVGIDQTTPGTTNKVNIGTDGTVAVAGSVAVTGTFFQGTQPVSGTVTANAGTGTQNVSVQNGSLAVTGAVPANGNSSGTLSASDAVVGAPDGVGTLLSGASTSGSVVAIQISDGFQAWTLLIKGYVSGTIYTEASTNSTNGIDGDWADIKGRRTGTIPGVESVTYAQVANGYYRGNAAGFKWIRARLIGGTGPTINWTLSNGAGAVFLNSGIPVGGSIIGKVGIDQTTPGTTNAVQVTNSFALESGGNLAGLNGKFSALGANSTANSTPVNIANDQTVNVTPKLATSNGSITIQNSVPAGAATAGSAVELSLNGAAGMAIQVTGTWTGALTLQITLDGSNWITYGGVPLVNINNGVPATTVASATAAIYKAEVVGALKARVTALAAVTGTCLVTLIAVQSNPYTTVNTQLPAGTQSIGNLGTVSTVTTVSTLSQFAASAAAADATANPTSTLIRNVTHNFNGATWDRNYNNIAVTLLASASRTTTQTSADIVNYNWKKLRVVLDMTVIGTGSVTVTINGKDSASAKYILLLSGAAVTTNSTNVYKIGETIAAVANSIAQDYLPRIIQIVVTANNANAATYSVGYDFGL